MSHSTFDVSNARDQFPALAQDQIFFDNAGGSQALATVIDSVRDYLSTTNVQLGGSYRVGKQSTARYEAGYEAGAKYINASRGEIVFGSSTTQLFRNLSQALEFEPGDELVISALDHEANIASWADLAARQNLTLKWWKPDPSPNPRLTPENLAPLLSDKTRLVAFTHASNVLGTIHDVKAITATAHRHPRALVCVDGVAYAPHRALDVADLGVDFYAFSWYKVYGPHIAMLYGGRRAQGQLRSLGHFFNASDTLEGKLGLAGASYELVAAVPAVLAYLGPPGSGGRWEALAAHEQRLQGALLAYLTGRGDVTVFGEPSADAGLRVPTVSFRVEGWEPKALVDAVQKETSFGFKSGHFYSYRLVQQTLGLDPTDGVVRVSLVHYNTVDEVKSFVSALETALAKRA